MITVKAEYSQFCKHIHSHLKYDGHSIKLASIREAVAQALQYRTASSLLSDLPVEITDTFIRNLNDVLLANHRVGANFTLNAFPFPERFPLTEQEREAVWRSFAEKIYAEINDNDFASVVFMIGTGVSVEGILKQPAPSELTPDGKGNWYCSSHTDISKRIPEISLDPQASLDAKSIPTSTAEKLGSNLKDIFYRYWNAHSKWCIVQAASDLVRKPVVTNQGSSVDISLYLDSPISESFEKLASCTSPSLNRFSHIEPNPFFPVDKTKVDSFENKLIGELISKIQGHCILNEMYSDKEDYQTLLWDELEVLVPFSNTSKRNKYDHYRDFIWCDAFTAVIRKYAFEWLEAQEDWSKSLRDLTIRPFTSPVEVEDRLYTTSESKFATHFHSETGTNLFVVPFGRGEDELGYHDDLDEDDDLYEYDESDFELDLTSTREALEREVEAGALSESEIEYYLNFEREERNEELEERKHAYEYSKPFVSPFRIERLTVDNLGQSGELNFFISGSYFSELLSPESLGIHDDLMDSMSREFQQLAQYVSNNTLLSDNEHFEGCDVFYVNDIYMTDAVNLDTLTTIISEGLQLSGRYPDNCVVVVNAQAITDRYFTGAPYSGCSQLKNEYEKFSHQLIEALDKIFRGAFYLG